MSFGQNQVSDFGVSDVELWGQAFTIAMMPAQFGRLLDQIEVRSTNIFTGKLPVTRSFCEAMERRQVSTMGGEGSRLKLGDFLDLVALLNTHARLARTGKVRMNGAAYWMANPGSRLDSRLPVLTWTNLEALSPRKPRDLHVMIPLLARDGVLRMVKCSDGEEGIVVMPGYAEEMNSRALMLR